jgi:prevent-host-death family protein
MVWKLADAKNKFSKVVDMALEVGPQEITRRDKAVVVVALKEFERLTGKKPGFKEYLMKAPSLKGISLDRDRSKVREANL